MQQKQIAICTRVGYMFKTPFIEYRVVGQRSVWFQGFSENDPDFDLAKKLKPGDKFEFEIRAVEIKPTEKFKIPAHIEQLPYITKIIPQKLKSKQRA